jgi:hypothetical protein
MVFADLRDVGASQSFDVRELRAAVRDMAFLNERYVIVSTRENVYKAGAYWIDRQSGLARPVCPEELDLADPRDHPRALAVDPTQKVIAMTTAEEVRVYRFKENAASTDSDPRTACDE